MKKIEKTIITCLSETLIVQSSDEKTVRFGLIQAKFFQKHGIELTKGNDQFLVLTNASGWFA